MSDEAPDEIRPSTRLVHATCISIAGHGVLITGAPASGKSDLALRLIDQAGCGTGEAPMNALLVADDQVLVARNGDTLLASPPPSLAGLLEIRGLGIITLQHAASCELALAVRLGKVADVERLPELSRSVLRLLDIGLPEIVVDPWAASAPARVRAAIVMLLRRGAEIAR